MMQTSRTHAPASSLRLACLLSALAALALVQLARVEVAHAQAPSCGGSDTERAATALAAGDRSVDRAARAMRRGPSAESRRAWSEALEAYDRACAAGADEALERRAIPLFRLERALEAAESLDAFLAAHPTGTLDERVAARVASNLQAIERAVGTALIVGSEMQGEIFVDGVRRGSGSGVRIHVAPDTEVRVEARAPGYRSAEVVVTLRAGEERTVLAPLIREPVVPTTQDRPSATPRSPVLVPITEAQAPGRPIGLAIGSAVAGGVTLLTGLTGTLLYLDSQAVTEIFYGEPDLDLALSVTLYVLSGLALVTTFSLLVAYLSSSTGPPSGASSARREPVDWACAPGLLGGACLGRF